MQATHPHVPTSGIPAGLPILRAPIPASASPSPAMMALHLRRTSGNAAYCFARVMYEESAWVNESWGAYWASVMRLV